MFDLFPSSGNPRNSEGSFIEEGGRLLFAYSRYAGTSSGDHAYAEIAMIESTDGGHSFSEPRIVVRPTPGTDETNCMSVSLLRLGNGDIGLFYLQKRENIVSEIMLRRSSDGGRSFGEPVRCNGSLPAYYVINNDRAIRMESGRILIPTAVHLSSLGFYGKNQSFDGRARAVFFASDDDGVSWRQLSDEFALPGGTFSSTGLQEPGAVELSPGVLYAYFRTDLGCQYESVSIDGGRTFTPPSPSRFTSPASPLHIRRNPHSGKLYAVWNPVPEYYGRPEPQQRWTGGRTPLVIAEGEFTKNGLSFGEPRVIEDDPEAGFCYPAIHFTSADRAVLAYCAGGVEPSDVSCLVRTRIRVIEL